MTDRPDHMQPSTATLYENGPARMKRCRYGTMLYPVTAPFIGRSLDLYGEYSEGEARLFCQVVKPGMTVLDIGANIGAHTLVLARATGPSGMVVAIEPQRAAVQFLYANLALNGIYNTRVLHCAVGETTGTIAVPAPDPDRPALGTVQVGAGAEQVRLATIDSFGLQRLDFAKIDVEGFEARALRGARETIARTRPILYVENDRAEHSAELIALLFDMGYACHWHLPPLFNRANYFRNPDNVFGAVASHNMLCIPRDREGIALSGFRAVRSPDDRWAVAVHEATQGQ